jgi:transcription antitermination factor NusG
MNRLTYDAHAGVPNWYAIYCKHKHERVVHSALTAKGVDSYLAEYETRAQWGTRLHKIKRNLLPGYVLVHIPAHDSGAYLSVLQTHGVVKFVGRPWPQLSAIPDEQIDSVQLLLGSQKYFEETAYFRTGESVEVIAGPLAGLAGRVINSTSRESRVIISIDLLQRSVAVEVDSALLRRLQTLKCAAYCH